MTSNFYFSLKISFFLEREKKRKSEWEEGHRQGISCRLLLSTEPDAGLKPMTFTSKSEIKPRLECPTDWTTKAPEGLAFFKFFKNFYLLMIVTQRERGRDTGRGRSRLHAPGARPGIWSRVSRIAPWAKGRHQIAAPPRDPWHWSLVRAPGQVLSGTCLVHSPLKSWQLF